MKKYLFFASLFVLLLVGNVLAYDFSSQTPSGQTLFYSVVKAKGVMVTSELSSAPYYHNSPVGELSIPSQITVDDVVYPVVAIDNNAFRDCKGLSSVAVPNTVMKIGQSAFAGCSGLNTLSIGPSVSLIEEKAFEDCGNVKTLYFNAVNCVLRSNKPGGSNGFAPMANSVTSLMIGEGVRVIPQHAFHGFSSLKSVVIPVSCTKIDDGAFCSCKSLAQVSFGSVSHIGDAAFCGCRSLKEADLPLSLTTIGDRSFAHCIALSKVVFPRSLRTIGKAAFVGCGALTSVNIPKSVLRIGDGAFGSGTAVNRK